MDAQKAIKELQSRIDLIEKDYKNNVPEYTEALKMAVSALKKQVAKKPERTGRVVQGLQENDEGHMIYVDIQQDYYECPKCGSFLGYAGDCADENYWYRYCADCGQAIDWSGVCDETENSLHEGDR